MNTILQACFFALSGVLPAQRAIGAIKEAIATTYAKRGEEVVQRNFHAVDLALDALHEVDVHRTVTAPLTEPRRSSDGTPDLIRELIAGRGDALPVSALPVDGTFPSARRTSSGATSPTSYPIWDESICIDCAKCALVCPHAAIRMKVYGPAALEGAPAGFKSKEGARRTCRGCS